MELEDAGVSLDLHYINDAIYQMVVEHRDGSPSVSVDVSARSVVPTIIYRIHQALEIKEHFADADIALLECLALEAEAYLAAIPPDA